MPTLPLSKYIDELKALEGLLAVDGKPRMLKFVGDQLYWLQGMDQELYSVNIADHNATPSRVIDRCRKGCTAAEGKEDSTVETKEEELLRERLRSRVTGISSYRVRCRDGAVFFTSGANIFLYRPASGKPPLKVLDYIGDEELKQRFSSEKKPFLCIEYFSHLANDAGACDSTKDRADVISFVYSNNLYIATVVEGSGEASHSREPPLRVNVECVTTFGDELHSCGDADYIIQEEFGRYTGHYATAEYVLFSYTDVSMLREVMLIDGSTDSGVEKMPYCRVGDPNARTVLVVYERRTKRYRVVPSSAIAAIAPWAEYMPRFGFKDEHTIYFSVLSRTQEKMSLLSCRINSLPVVDAEALASCFSEAARDTDVAAVAAGTTLATRAATVNLTTEWHQHIPWAWVDVQPGVALHLCGKYEVLVRHANESESAHSHVYARAQGGDEGSWRPLTCGAWNVRAGGLIVKDDRVFFLANARNRLESVLYSVVINLDAGPVSAEELTQLTPSGEHVYSFAVLNNTLCYVSSTATTPAELHISSINNPGSRWVVPTRHLWDDTSEKAVTPRTTLEGLTVPHIINIVNRRGVPLSGRLFVSPHAALGKLNPLAMYIYGGPHAQLVYDSDFDGACKPIFQMLASFGISVLVADGQMSNANGLRDHSICKHSMGSFETSDYVDWVRHMTNCKELPCGFCADPERVAIFGWSYGGYATLLAMSQAPDVFKIGFAGAPVGDWTLYDTGYTERYMGLLHTNADRTSGSKGDATAKCAISDAYTRSAIKAFASNFPEELNRVFIAHGLLDENVHFCHTSVVVNAMIDAGKPCCSVVYPGERHSLRKKKASRLHHDAMLAKTLMEVL
ncbi:dipeptidyl-peptidase 8-like serine protease [Trypanosoma brucei gambiense DAL972]|uniref:Dipeptidyl-peptidase 8-like serine protease n=2 Tax=Trypanosoma brucei TaxID=5691 RepID=D0A3B6_TRYB9|nr:dipeptidyl-peptidase 8-like serine protease [Trypanosoma brucei gambiense DAL972]RHW69562.1 dipeptidyl-peptidase 8-like serine peptidase [Trypanosoma brucei equiperdum]CBH15760.1 dipeptidyl-peptidase 8-like serine protease [Trypanosoma brucei gambiense DAL972]|eukprot:XP_011778024.1 dipeptidyl-peptidase 8-like serine protease [Trypanosoma brucei gambiense DAL972]